MYIYAGLRGSNARLPAKQTNSTAAAAVERVAASESMKRASPKYVPREWMLVEAYSAAAAGDHTVVHRLQELFRAPYDEQPEFEARYALPD